MEFDRNLTVLVIEEDKHTFSEIKKHLHSVNDFDVSLIDSYSYDEGSTIFREEDIDVCFLTAEMRDQSSDDFLSKIEAQKKHVPIILIYGQSPSEELLDDGGVNNYVLRENFSPSVFNKAIRNAIEHNEINLQLLAQEEKYSKLFYSSLEAVFTIDENYELLECNDSFRELFGITDLKKFDLKKIFLLESEELFDQLANNKAKRSRKTQITNSKGEEIIAYLSISPVDSEIEEAQFIGIVHDVTELENAQLKLAENDKLQLIQRMARIIGHEIRNPLTNVFLATEELKHDFSENEDAIEMLEMIHRNSTRISGLIDNFLKNSRTDELVKDMHSIEKVLSDSIEVCSDRITLKNIKMVTDGLDEDTLISLDEQKVTIAFTNILINATEALEGIENPLLTVSVKKFPLNVEIVVEDNGIGMSEELKQNLFVPFYSSKQGGLGLGMSNTFSILKKHDAIIDVESQLGKGTQFKISFPRQALAESGE